MFVFWLFWCKQYTAPCLTHSFPHLSRHPSPHLHLVRLPLPAVIPVDESLPLHRRGALADWLNNSHLTGYGPKSLIEVTSEHTPIKLPARKGSLATTLDASDVCDTTDVGRLTTIPFSQEREVSADPFGVSFSQTLSSVGKCMRDVEQFSSFRIPLSKGQRNRDLECVQDSQMGRESILSEQRDIYDFLEKKGDHVFQRECAAQTTLPEAQAELDRREWRMQHADIALYATGMHLQSQKVELYQANQPTDQTRREQSWVCDELEMRHSAFQEIANQLKN